MVIAIKTQTFLVTDITLMHDVNPKMHCKKSSVCAGRLECLRMSFLGSVMSI